MPLSFERVDTGKDIEHQARSISQLDRLIFSDPWTAEQWQSDLLAPQNKTFLLIDTADPVGLLNFAITENFADLKKIGIRPEHQNRGYASFLMGNFLQTLAGYYVTTVFLEVAESNFAARRLYEKFHFKEYLRRKKYYAGQIDAICMRHEL